MSRFDIDKELLKKAKHEVLKLIATENQASFNLKVSESIGKPKELWESLKYLSIPNKTLITKFNAIEDNDNLTYDTQTISLVLKKFFPNLAESFLTELPNLPDKYNLESVINFYSSFTITDDFCLNKTSECKVLKIIQKIDISKSAGIDKFSGSFLQD